MITPPGSGFQTNHSLSGIVAVVTTPRKPNPALMEEAEALSSRLGAVYVARTDSSIESLREQHAGVPVLVVQQDKLVCYHGDRPFFFHPGMVRLRLITDLLHTDPLFQALQTRPGDQVLDATLGRAADAILISAAVGASGQVIGLEISPVLAEIARHGLSTYQGPTAEIEAAMRRIQVVQTDYLEYLKGCPDHSMDSVYFDPMFDRPIPGSSSLDPMRSLASHETLSQKALEEGCRVARRRVVVKSRRGAETLAELGIETVIGGRSSPISYGVIEV